MVRGQLGGEAEGGQRTHAIGGARAAQLGDGAEVPEDFAAVYAAANKGGSRKIPASEEGDPPVREDDRPAATNVPEHPNQQQPARGRR